MLNKIIEIFSIPILILNAANGIVGGIWLAILGEWKLVGIGILIIFTDHWILSMLSTLCLPIVAISAYFFEKKNPLGYLFGFLSLFYSNFLIIGSIVLVFFI